MEESQGGKKSHFGEKEESQTESMEKIRVSSTLKEEREGKQRASLGEVKKP